MEEKDYKFTEKDIRAVNGFVDFLNGATGSNIEKFKIPCEYCANNIKNKKIKDVDNDKEDWIELVCQPALKSMLYVELDGEDSDGYKTRDFFKINYCPMCGRKLEV